MGRPKKPLVDSKGQRVIFPGPRMVELEKDVLEQIASAVRACGCMVMRNSVGLAKHGNRKVAYGLGKGSADLVAIVPPHGRWLTIEVKRPKGGRVSREQLRWMEWVRMMGGVAGVARNVADALKLVAEARHDR